MCTCRFVRSHKCTKVILCHANKVPLVVNLRNANSGHVKKVVCTRV
jgi:hypothetical protein